MSDEDSQPLGGPDGWTNFTLAQAQQYIEEMRLEHSSRRWTGVFRCAEQMTEAAARLTIENAQLKQDLDKARATDDRHVRALEACYKVQSDLRAKHERADAWTVEVMRRLCAAAGVDLSQMDEPSIEDMESAIKAERDEARAIQQLRRLCQAAGVPVSPPSSHSCRDMEGLLLAQIRKFVTLLRSGLRDLRGVRPGLSEEISETLATVPLSER